MSQRLFWQSAFLAVLGILFHFPTPAAAQDEKPAEQAPPPGWTVQCSNAGDGLQCAALQTIALRETGQHLITITVRRNPDGASAAMLMQVPHGLFLPAGLTMKIDEGETQSVEFQTCDARGCYAGTRTDAGQIDALEKGNVLAVSFQNLSKKAITINVPLTGFTAAYEKTK